MKNILFVFLFPVLLIASGGDTLQYSSEVENLTDGDAFYADQHWHSMKDSVQSILNGRVGNINLAADALINPSKFDSTKTTVTSKLRADTVTSVDTLYGAVVKSIRARVQNGIIDTINSTYGNFTLFDTINTPMLIADSAKIGNAVFGSKPSILMRSANSPFFEIGDDVSNYCRFSWVSGANCRVIADGNSVLDFHDTYVEPIVKLVLNDSLISGRQRIQEYGQTTRNYYVNVLDNKFQIYNDAATPASLFSIDSTGNVGIDTTTPGSTLHIAGSARVRDTLHANVGNFTLLDTIRATYDTTKIIISDSMKTRTLITTGKVGIGTTPTYQLEVSNNQNAATICLLQNTNNHSAAYPSFYASSYDGCSMQLIASPTNATGAWSDKGVIYSSGNSGMIIEQAGNFPINFYTNSDSVMTITGAGDVGIDTMSPGSKLHVAGSIRARDTVYANTISTNTYKFNTLNIGAKVEHTIASNAITFSATNILLDTEGDAALDTLTTINGGSDGDLIYLSTVDSDRDVYVGSTGNINTDITLSANTLYYIMIYNSNISKWLVK